MDKKTMTETIHDTDFGMVVSMIREARQRAYRAANSELINLYWKVGEYLNNRMHSNGWGKGVVVQLAAYIQSKEPNAKGFSDKNLWRMKQFYETYKDYPELSTLSRELSWSHNILLLSKCSTNEEREYYIRKSLYENYSYRELERQIDSSDYERTLIGGAKLSTLQRVLPATVTQNFKEQYVLDFLNINEPIREDDLQKGLVREMKRFILELGKDFLFMGDEYRLQVGSKDFYIDLLFYHRSLRCLVAFELKTTDFKPDYLGQLNFYLEALDRDVRKPDENPSIGVLLCKGKDDEVVEYALSRSMSPTMVSQYELALPNKEILQAKLRELGETNNMN